METDVVFENDEANHEPRRGIGQLVTAVERHPSMRCAIALAGPICTRCSPILRSQRVLRLS